jgi:hypothetical protein
MPWNKKAVIIYALLLRNIRLENLTAVEKCLVL